MVLYIGNKLLKHGNTPSTADLIPTQLSDDIDIMAVSNKKNMYIRMLDILWSVIKYRSRTSLIFIDTYSTKNFYYALAVASLARVFKIPYIPVLHGGNLLFRLEKFPYLSKLIFKYSAINIAPSYFLYNIFHEHKFAVQHLSNSIELDMYKYKKRSGSRIKLLYVRAFAKIYNPKMAIYAMAELVKIFPDAYLCMVGPDKDGTLDECKKLVEELCLQNNIEFPGKLPKKKWIDISTEYDYFINTTNYDNMPVSVMEAMALGLIVISTNVGGIPYLIDDRKNGVLVNANDHMSLVKTIIDLNKSEELTENLSLEARRTAEKLDWIEIRKQWIDLIEEKKRFKIS